MRCTLSDITELTVVIKKGDYAGEDCATDQVTYTWTHSGGNVSPWDSTGEIITANCNAPTLTDTSGDWGTADESRTAPLGSSPESLSTGQIFKAGE